MEERRYAGIKRATGESPKTPLSRFAGSPLKGRIIQIAKLLIISQVVA